MTEALRWLWNGLAVVGLACVLVTLVLVAMALLTLRRDRGYGGSSHRSPDGVPWYRHDNR